MLMGGVRVALRRPYTFAVMALLLLIVGPLVARRTATDIFPETRIPVIAVAWQYTGLPPDQRSHCQTTVDELGFSSILSGPYL
jgi:multidrug efflux pump subunit AcrB